MKTPFKRGDNIRFIADRLFKKPGSTMTEVRRALCKFRDKGYTRGQYAQYFAKAYIHGNRRSYVDHYWYKGDGGWYLTIRGYGLVTENPEERLA
jgi:hypothetical protein